MLNDDPGMTFNPLNSGEQFRSSWPSCLYFRRKVLTLTAEKVLELTETSELNIYFRPLLGHLCSKYV